VVTRICGGRANFRHQQAFFAGQRCDLTQRAFKVFLDIVAQRLQWRYIKDLSAVSKIAAQGLAHQPINTYQEGCQRFAGTRRRRD
jgi:hypothetical protein